MIHSSENCAKVSIAKAPLLSLVDKVAEALVTATEEGEALAPTAEELVIEDVELEAEIETMVEAALEV